MSCQACVRIIENKFKQIAGIHSMNVSLNEHKAIVKFDESILNIESIIQTLDDLGFSASVDPLQ